MHRYTLYLLVSTLKKKTTTLVPLLFAVFFGTLLSLQAKANKMPFPTIFYLWDYFYYIPFLFGALYVGIKAINVFKDGAEDGSELLIISRPIPRSKVLLAKFLVMFLHIIFFTFVVFFTCLIAAQSDVNKSTPAQMFYFSLSVGIGTLVICLLLSTIIILIASITSKLGTMIAIAVIPFLLIVFSAIVTVVSKGDTQWTPYRRYVYSSKKNQKTANGFSVPSDYIKYNDSTVSRQKTGWYNSIKYFDVFTQLNSFYKVLMPGVVNPTTPQRVSKNTLNINDSLTDIYFDGTNFKNETIPFAYAPTMRDDSLPTRRMHSLVLEHKDELADSLYNFISEHYKAPTKGLSKEKVLDIENTNKLIHPIDFDVTDPKSIEENNLKIRTWKNMGKVIMGYLLDINENSPKNKINLINNFIRVSHFSGEKTKSFNDSIKFFKNYFIDNERGNGVIPISIFIIVYHKIYEQKALLASTDKSLAAAKNLITPKEKIMLNDFKPLIIDGEYTLKRKGSKPVNIYGTSKSYGIFKKGDVIPQMHYSPWVSKNQVYGIWISLMIIFAILTVFRYFKQDFR